MLASRFVLAASLLALLTSALPIPEKWTDEESLPEIAEHDVDMFDPELIERDLLAILPELAKHDLDGYSFVVLEQRAPIDPTAAVAAGIKVFNGVTDIVKGVKQKVEADKEVRAAWTQETIAEAKKKDPSFNYVMAHTKHDFKPEGQEGKDWTKVTKKYDAQFGKDKNFDLYAFKKGTFKNKGDGGFINWAYDGNVKDRKGKTVTFDAPVQPKAATPAASKSTQKQAATSTAGGKFVQAQAMKSGAASKGAGAAKIGAAGAGKGAGRVAKSSVIGGTNGAAKGGAAGKTASANKKLPAGNVPTSQRPITSQPRAGAGSGKATTSKSSSRTAVTQGNSRPPTPPTAAQRKAQAPTSQTAGKSTAKVSTANAQAAKAPAAKAQKAKAPPSKPQAAKAPALKAQPPKAAPRKK